MATQTPNDTAACDNLEPLVKSARMRLISV